MFKILFIDTIFYNESIALPRVNIECTPTLRGKKERAAIKFHFSACLIHIITVALLQLRFKLS